MLFPQIDKGLERMDEIQHDFKEQLDADNERIEKEKSLRATVEWLQTKYREELDSVQQEGVEGKLKDVKARINGWASTSEMSLSAQSEHI